MPVCGRFFMNRGHRNRTLRIALAVVIVGLVIVGACVGSPRAKKHRADVCPDKNAPAAVQPVRTPAASCRIVVNP